jgi:hypothetical protein
MAGLKSFLYGAAPILGTTGAALYERQRALVNLRILTPLAGRGPGSGVPLTSYNVAAILISVLATDNLAEVDDRVLSLMNATTLNFGHVDSGTDAWKRAGKPTFCTTIAAVLADAPMPWPFTNKRPVLAIRVARCWRGQLLTSPRGANPTEFTVADPSFPERPPISVTASIEDETFNHLVSFTRGALSQVAAEEDDE